MAEIELVEPPGDASNPRGNWPETLQREFEDNRNSGVVGSILVSETDRLRVLHLHLPPGVRCGFHRHVLNYFWSCHSHGKARGWYDDGRIQDVTHYPGETKHFTFADGEDFIHSVMNVGDTDLLFTTVEFKDSPNTPLPVPDNVRLKEQT